MLYRFLRNFLSVMWLDRRTTPRVIIRRPTGATTTRGSIPCPNFTGTPPDGSLVYRSSLAVAQVDGSTFHERSSPTVRYC